MQRSAKFSGGNGEGPRREIYGKTEGISIALKRLDKFGGLGLSKAVAKPGAGDRGRGREEGRSDWLADLRSYIETKYQSTYPELRSRMTLT